MLKNLPPYVIFIINGAIFIFAGIRLYLKQDNIGAIVLMILSIIILIVAYITYKNSKVERDNRSTK